MQALERALSRGAVRQLRGQGFKRAVDAVRQLDAAIDKHLLSVSSQFGMKREREHEEDEPVETDQESHELDFPMDDATDGRELHLWQSLDWPYPEESEPEEEEEETIEQLSKRLRLQYPPLVAEGLADFPVHLLIDIFKFVGNAGDFLLLASTSKHLREIAQERSVLEFMLTRIVEDPSFLEAPYLLDRDRAQLMVDVSQFRAVDAETQGGLSAQTLMDALHAFTCDACVRTRINTRFSTVHVAGWIYPFIAARTPEDVQNNETVEIRSYVTFRPTDDVVLLQNLQTIKITATNAAVPRLPQSCKDFEVNVSGAITQFPDDWPMDIKEIRVIANEVVPAFIPEIPASANFVKILVQGDQRHYPYVRFDSDLLALMMDEGEYAQDPASEKYLHLQHCRLFERSMDWFRRGHYAWVHLDDVLVQKWNIKAAEGDGLHELRLKGCRITVSPVLAQFRTLSNLDLSNTPCGQWLDNLDLNERSSKLKNVMELTLKNTGLTRFPRWVAMLSQLEELDVSHNTITELPTDLPLRREMHHFDASHNQIHGTLDITNFGLQVDVSHNHITNLIGPAPAWMDELDIRHNPLDMEQLGKVVQYDTRSTFHGHMITVKNIVMKLLAGPIELPAEELGIWVYRPNHVVLHLNGPKRVMIYGPGVFKTIHSDTIEEVEFDLFQSQRRYRTYLHCPNLRTIRGYDNASALNVHGGRLEVLESHTSRIELLETTSTIMLKDVRIPQTLSVVELMYGAVDGRSTGVTFRNCVVEDQPNHLLRLQVIHMLRTLDFGGTTGMHHVSIQFQNMSATVFREETKFIYRGCNISGTFPHVDVSEDTIDADEGPRTITIRRPQLELVSHPQLPANIVQIVLIDLSDNPALTAIDYDTLVRLPRRYVVTFDVSGTGIMELPDYFFYRYMDTELEFHTERPQFKFIVDVDQLRAMSTAHPELRAWQSVVVKPLPGGPLRYMLTN